MVKETSHEICSIRYNGKYYTGKRTIQELFHPGGKRMKAITITITDLDPCVEEYAIFFNRPFINAS